ncbi:MAG: ACT domain-containing protein [Ktedonobacterales bacterium]
MSALTLSIVPHTFAICRLAANAPLPTWLICLTLLNVERASPHAFCSITRTADELSILCVEDIVPADVVCERGWRGLVIQGPLDLALTGILASLLAPLATADVNILALSTYDTDYIFVKNERLIEARQALEQAGHRVTP